jgi:hypothetical protein
MGDSDASNLCPLKRMFFFLFLSLQHPNLENISIFYLPLFNSIAKNLFLGIKILKGHLLHLHPLCYPYTGMHLRVRMHLYARTYV